MDVMRSIFLGVLQGATEFVPVSSSGHLVLVPWLLQWESPSLAFNAVVHWGTAAAVIGYFWQDWVSLIGAGWRSLRDLASAEGNAGPDAAEMSLRATAWLIVLATVPGVLVGFFFEDFFEAMFARPAGAAAFLLVTAALLAGSERWGRRERELDELGWVDALVIGMGQALAIFPGVSRSGATIAAGLVQGMKREPAARFSFLLSTPIIAGAGLLKVLELARTGGLTAQGPVLAAGFTAAAVVGFGCIHFLLRYLQRRRLYPFAIYCALFGLLSLSLALMG